jgi:DNA-binding transcriptional ArsR family regulator
MENTELSTTDLAKRMGMSIPSLMYHLDIMVKENVLAYRNEGRKVIYRIKSNTVRKVCDLLHKHSVASYMKRKRERGEVFEKMGYAISADSKRR